MPQQGLFVDPFLVGCRVASRGRNRESSPANELLTLALGTSSACA